MKKETLILLLSGITWSGFAQKAEEIHLFKDKNVKMREGNIFSIDVDALTKNVLIVAAIKKDQAETITFDPALKLTKREEIPFDLEAQMRSQATAGEQKYVEEDGKIKLIVQENLLRVKPPGMDFYNKTISDYGKVGLGATGSLAGLIVEKGRIVKYAYQKQSDWNMYLGYQNKINGIQTQFEPTEKVKLKSEENKNLTYEFHKTFGTEFLFVDNAVGTSRSLKKDELGSVSEKMIGNNVNIYKPVKTTFQVAIKKNALSDGDVLILTKRNQLIKFGQKPTDQDLLPYYYVQRINAKTLEITDSATFQEPLERAIIYRNALAMNGGILIVSAPLKVTGSKMPKDENPRNYIIRHIGDDARMKWEIPLEVPAGYTRFTESFEPDGKTIVLMAHYNAKNTDKHVNKVSPIHKNEDDLYMVVIREGKILSTTTIANKDWVSSFINPPGEKAETFFSPATLVLKVNSVNWTEDGDMIVSASTPYLDPKTNLNKNAGNLVFHLDKNGKLKSRYWIAGDDAVAAALDPVLIRMGDKEFYWLTFKSANGSEYFMYPQINKLDIGNSTLGSSVKVGDEKHFTNINNSFIIDEEGKKLYFFGFDKSGKEFWNQNVQLD